MPHLFGDTWVVTKDELIPQHWNCYSSLKTTLRRYKDKPYGIKRVQLGGNGRQLLIDFYSLPKAIQEDIGDPQKHEHWLLNLYEEQQETYEFYTNYTYPDGSYLSPEAQERYITNANVIQAVLKLKELRTADRIAKNGSLRGIMKSLSNDVNSFNPFLKKHHKTTHNLPSHPRRFRELINKYQKEGLKALVKDARGKSKANAKKLTDNKQEAVLRELLRKHNNFDNVQIQDLYNGVAGPLGWKAIEASTVANYRSKWNFTTYAGTAGEVAFDSNKAMQHKRTAPTHPLYYWTADGWDVELLYQKTSIDKKGKSVTTYHNRLTVVVVLDAFKKYPVGYAIGTHENPLLIRQAFRNAIKHTEELFGAKHKALQLQTDRYALKNLQPFYEGLTEQFTPAQARNAKAKIIEPWFSAMNKKYFQLMDNWSGFNVTAKKENQPNSQYLNKIRHSFPDEMGCRMQIEKVLEMERAKLQTEYIAAYDEMPATDKITMSDETYLYQLGETTGFTNKLVGSGLHVMLNGVERTYDSFDMSFRQFAHFNWCVMFDPDNVENVLVCNAKSTNGRLKEMIGTHRFMLTEKYVQPMAMRERGDEDAKQLKAVNDFNKEAKEMILDEMANDRALTQEVFADDRVEGTLAKMILTDSNGQHKNNKSQARLTTAQAIAKQYKQSQKKVDDAAKRDWQQQQDEYLDKKTDLSKYL